MLLRTGTVRGPPPAAPANGPASPQTPGRTLSPCEERAGRESERGGIDKKRLLSPALSSFFEEERERKCGCALKANLLPNTTGLRPAGALPASQRLYKSSASVALNVLRLTEPRSVILEGCEKLAGG